MKLTRSLIRPFRSGAATSTSTFFRRRLRSNGTLRGGRSAFFTRRRGGAAVENPEPSSPKVTCIGQVRVKSQKKVKQCRRRINGEASFRSAEPSFQHQQRRDQRWVHLPSLSVVLRALGHEFCCLFRCCRCSCSCCGRRERGREREKIRRSGSGCFADENGRGELFGRWLVAVNAGDGGGNGEIEVVVDGGEEEEMMLGANSRRHVFDDIEVIGDRIEVKGQSFNGSDREGGGVSISIPPKNALLLMRCRSDPIKMAAIANRISSDAGRYENGGVGIEEEEDDEEEEYYDNGSELKIFVTRVSEKEEEMNNNVGENENGCDEEKPPPPPLICNEEKAEEEECNEEEKEEVESNMSSFEALLEQENTDNYRDLPIEEDETKAEESVKSDEDKTSTNIDENQNPTNVEGNDKQEKKPLPLPENPETAAPAPALPECLLLMMREPKLSMEVSKETWVCATDFIRLLPERPRRAATKAAAVAAGGDHEPAVKRRVAVERSKPRVPAPPGKKNEMQPARSSCSLPAAAGGERKRVGGGACEPLALTRCKSEPMSTAAAKLMPEAGCWKENVGNMQVEPHRQASLGVGAAGVGC